MSGTGHTFNRIVVIEPDQPGRLRRIANVRQAAEALLEWPQEGRGPIFERAARSCRAALARTGTVSAARSAFVAAARNAGVLVSEADSGR
jgi:hypothetical protein